MENNKKVKIIEYIVMESLILISSITIATLGMKYNFDIQDSMKIIIIVQIFLLFTLALNKSHKK